jgi:hypothetical protein
MNLTRLHQTAALFEKLAFDTLPPQLLSFVVNQASQRPTNKELDSWIEANQTTLSTIRNVKWRVPMGRDLWGDHGAVHILLTQNSNPPPEYEARSSAFLRGSKPFPNLYVHQMMPAWGRANPWDKAETETVNLPRQYVPYAYLGQAFAEIMRVDFADIIKDTIEFIHDHKAKLDYIARGFGGTPILLGSGSDGSAFSVGRDRVLKIFRDRSAYEAARAAQKRLWEGGNLARTEAMIHDVGEIGDFLGNQIFYYVIERMKPVKNYDMMDVGAPLSMLLELIRVQMRANRSVLNRLRKMVHHPRIGETVKMVAARITKRVQQYIADNKHMKAGMRSIVGAIGEELEPDWLEKLVEEILVKWMTGRTDLSTSNLGISGGRLSYYDPAFDEKSVPKDTEEMVRI